MAKKTQTKKDLEAKIADLEAKLNKLSSQLSTKPTPPPKPAETNPQARLGRYFQWLSSPG